MRSMTFFMLELMEVIATIATFRMVDSTTVNMTLLKSLVNTPIRGFSNQSDNKFPVRRTRRRL